jgi:glycosyltransferase involved in cell wall biosynthesis
MEITAIIPNYNHARFLGRRLDSIYNQTYPHLRVILLDDASTDNSRDILESYRHHPRTQAIIYNEVNSGSPFLQWKKGLDLVETEWVWIAESDDFCETNFLESLEPGLNTAECVLAYAQLKWVDEFGVFIKDASPPETAGWYEGKVFAKNYLLGCNRLQNAGMLVFRKSAALQAHPRWLHMMQAGDYWLWAEVAAQGRVYGSGKSICYFTKHEQSVSAKHLHTHRALFETSDTWWQMLSIGSISKNEFKKHIEAQLVGLIFQRKCISKEDFKENWLYWKKLIKKAGGHYNFLWIQLLVIKAKLSYWQRRLKNAF